MDDLRTTPLTIEALDSSPELRAQFRECMNIRRDVKPHVGPAEPWGTMSDRSLPIAGIQPAWWNLKARFFHKGDVQQRKPKFQGGGWPPIPYPIPPAPKAPPQAPKT